ncbi:MAG TPA: hypothetical protein VN678_13185 [Acidobacteriaceae bacterium]|nr:hypothetical protein [Acidobacteriaceae bacterium]
MTIRIINEKRIIPNAIVGALIFFVVETGLYWDEFATRGLWPSIMRRLMAAVFFFVFIVAINGREYAKRQRKEQQPT